MSAPRSAAVGYLAVLALLCNAFIWGVSWWPFRYLNDRGLHPLWATALVYAFSLVCVSLVRPRAWRGMLATPALWWLVVAAGLTNVSFNWAVTVGDVVRVVLLFYLMPAWSMLIAWWQLGERPTRRGLWLLALAWVGVMLVVTEPWRRAVGASGAPTVIPLGFADALGVLGGATFAFNNVMLRKLHVVPNEERAFAMFFGGCLCSAVVGITALGAGQMGGLPSPAWDWAGVALALSVFFLLGNLALQYGAARLSARTTSLVMLCEVVFASASAVALGAAQLQTPEVIGGALILAGAIFAPWAAKA